MEVGRLVQGFGLQGLQPATSSSFPLCPSCAQGTRSRERSRSINKCCFYRSARTFLIIFLGLPPLTYCTIMQTRMLSSPLVLPVTGPVRVSSVSKRSLRLAAEKETSSAGDSYSVRLWGTDIATDLQPDLQSRPQPACAAENRGACAWRDPRRRQARCRA